MSDTRFQLLPMNAEGKPIFEMGPRRGSANTRAIDIYSPDLCDQTTWYQQTTEAQYVLQPEGSSMKVWSAGSAHNGHVWFNVNACTMQEGRLLMKDGTFRYRRDFFPVLSYNGSPIPWSDIESIDYTNKRVTFKTAKPDHPVAFAGAKVDKNQFLEFCISPPYGIEIFLAYAEIQFSLDVDFSNRGGVRFEILSGLGHMLTKNPPEPYPIPFYAIPMEHGLYDHTIYDIYSRLGVYEHAPNNLFVHHVGTRQDYYRTHDFEVHSNVGKNVIPKWGGRDYETIEFPFNYLSGIPLKGSQFFGVRVGTIDSGNPADMGPLPGSTGTVSFYTEWSYEQG